MKFEQNTIIADDSVEILQASNFDEYLLYLNKLNIQQLNNDGFKFSISNREPKVFYKACFIELLFAFSPMEKYFDALESLGFDLAKTDYVSKASRFLDAGELANYFKNKINIKQINEEKNSLDKSINKANKKNIKKLI